MGSGENRPQVQEAEIQMYKQSYFISSIADSYYELHNSAYGSYNQDMETTEFARPAPSSVCSISVRATAGPPARQAVSIHIVFRRQLNDDALPLRASVHPVFLFHHLELLILPSSGSRSRSYGR